MELEGRGGGRGRSSVTGVLTLPLGNIHQQQQAAVTELRLHLRFNLFSPDGKTLWKGEVVAPREQADRYVVFAMLVPVLLASIVGTNRQDDTRRNRTILAQTLRESSRPIYRNGTISESHYERGENDRKHPTYSHTDPHRSNRPLFDSKCRRG